LIGMIGWLRRSVWIRGSLCGCSKRKENAKRRETQREKRRENMKSRDGWHRAAAWFAAVVACAAFAPLDAQEIRVRVVDDRSGVPVSGVAVTVVTTRDVAALAPRVTDSLGTATFAAVPAGRYRIRARRIGIEPTLTDAKTLDAGARLVWVVKVRVIPQTLDTVNVVARSVEERLLQLRKSMAGGVSGRIYTPRDLDSLHFMDLADAVNSTPGAKVRRTNRGLLSFGCRGGRANFFLNGSLVSMPGDESGAFTELMRIDMRHVKLLEVWPSKHTLPAEYSHYAAGCAVAVWTRPIRSP
jgi:hypothetical protein